MAGQEKMTTEDEDKISVNYNAESERQRGLTFPASGAGSVLDSSARASGSFPDAQVTVIPSRCFLPAPETAA